MKSFLFLLAVIYSAPVFASTLQLSCDYKDTVELNISDDLVKLKISDYYAPGRSTVVTSGPAVVIESQNRVIYKLDRYQLQKRNGNYHLIEDQGAAGQVHLCQVTN